MRGWGAAVRVAVAGALLTGSSGCSPGILWACARPEVTAVSLNPCDGHLWGKESGIPFYLPKPLLIVSKNFRNIESPTTGLTDSPPIPGAFDDQAKYADVNARTNFVGLNPGVAAPPAGAGGRQADPTPPPGTAYKSAPTLHSAGAPVSPGKVPGDGLAPDTFFTYQIVFVPDLTKRYGLKIRGGPGEIRAAMNLVNGWQFTGIGPFYMKDSATAQNILSQGISNRLGGQAAADVINASADLAKVLGVPGGGRQGGDLGTDDPRVRKLSEAIGALPANLAPMTLVNYAEIHVYEPNTTPDGRMEWCEIVHLQFNRDYLGTKAVCVEMGSAPGPNPAINPGGGGGPQAGAIVNLTDDSVARTAVAALFGVPAGSPALAPPGGFQSGGVAGMPAGGVNQIQVDCGDKGGCHPSREFNLFKFGHGRPTPRATIQNRALTGGAVLVPGATVPPAVEWRPVSPGGGTPLGGGPQTQPLAVAPAPPAIINQPIFNQPLHPPTVVQPPPIPPARPE